MAMNEERARAILMNPDIFNEKQIREATSFLRNRARNLHKNITDMTPAEARRILDAPWDYGEKSLKTATSLLKQRARDSPVIRTKKRPSQRAHPRP